MKILDTMNVGTVGLNVGNIQAYQSAIKGLSAEQAVFALATKGANAAQIEEIMTTETATLAKGTYTQADVQAAMAKHGLATASAILTVEQQKEITNSGLLSAEKMAEMASVLGLTTAENGSLVSKKALNAEMVKQQLESIGIVGTTQAQIMSILGLATAETGAVAGTNLLTASFAKLWAVISAHPIGAIITAVGALAVGVVSAINASNKAKEEARQTAIELTNAYIQEKNSLDSQIEKYKELKETLDKGNLSTDETRSIKEQLLGIQESLIESYGSEASNIDLVNGKYREQLGLLNELSKEKATDYVTENRDVFADAKEALEKIRTYDIGTILSWNNILPKTEEQQALLDFIESYSDLFEITTTGSTSYGGANYDVRNLKINATVEDADNIMHQFAKDLEKYANENNIDVTGILENISGQLKKTWTDELTEYKTVYDEFMKAEIVRNDTLRPLYQESIKAVEDYNNALSTGKGVEEAKANLDSVQQSVQNATGELEGSQDVFDGIYDGINKDAEAAYNLGQAFANDKTVQEYAEQLRGLLDIDLQAINFDDTVEQPGEKAFTALIDYLGYTREEAQKLIDKLVELGYVQGDIQGSTPTNEIDLLSISSTIDQLNTQLKPAMDSLESAWNNIFTDDGFTLENIDLSTFEAIKSKLDEMSKLGLEVDMSSFEDFVTVLNDTDSTAEQVKDAFDDLATSIVDAGVSGIEDFQLLKDTLQEMGVQNFEMVAFEELVKNTETLKAAGLDLVNATDVQIQAFAEEMVSAENAAQAYNLLLYAKELNNLAKMSTAGEVAELQNLAERAGVTGDIIQWLTRLQLVYQQVANRTLDPQTIQDYVFEAKELTAKIQNAATEVKFSGNEVDYKPLTKAAGKAGKEAGESYKDKLKDELSGLGDVLNYINDIIGDQIDLLGDQKDAAVDALNAEKEAAEAALQAQIDLVEAQIDAIEKQIEAKKKEIDKIKEAREERQREIDLQKKQFELLRMQNQKTSLIYKGEPGQFVYETDTQGIRDARESLAEAKENIYIAGIEKEISLLEDEISNLEDVIDSLNNQIEASNKYYEDLIKSTENYYDGLIKNLEDYQNRWKEIGEIEEQAKIQVKLKELGITAEDVLNMSEDAFNSFKQQYLSILTEMYSGEQDMIQAINDVANGIDLTALTEGLNQTKENIDNLNGADFNSVSTGLNDVSDGMGNVGTSASSASEGTSSVSSDLQEMNTNAEGLDTKLSNISSALNGIPNSERFDELTTSFTNLGTAIQSVADALGISGEDSVSGLVTALTELSSFSLSGEKGEGGIIEQFQNLKTAVDEVTSAINGGGSTGESASATNASGARTGSSMGTGNSTAGGGSGLTGAIKEIGTTTDETIGSGGENEGTDSRGSEGEGVLGKFGQFKSAVEEVTKAIGTGEDEESGEEGATSLISALQLHYEKAGETLPEVKNMFEELLAKILECVSALGELAGAMSSLGGEGFAFGTVGTGFASGTDPKASFTTTVGKAFAKGAGRFKGLPKDEKNALRSEYGQPELTVYPDGTTELTTEPTMSDLPKDTVIFNEEQTKRIMSNKGTVIGNAYAEGNATVEKSSQFDNMRDLQPGDRMYDLLQKWNAYFEKNDHSFIEPVNAIQKNTDEIARSVSNVNTNNIQRSVNIGDINITCPGVTSNEVAKQITTELHKQIGGIALEVLQESHITR